MLLNVNREKDYDDVTIDLGTGAYPELWDARSGKVTRPVFRELDGRILLTMDLEKGGERIFLLADRQRELPDTECFPGGEPVKLPDTFRYRLTEPNICVLDMVSVADDKGNAIPRTEVLKADRALRDILGIPYRSGDMLQPWYQIKYKGGNTTLLSSISLEYDVEIEKTPGDIRLAVEDLAHIRRILVNGEEISLTGSGKWVDICFDELKIPAGVLTTGRNTITIFLDYYATSGIEAAYLLGDFGVRTEEDKPVIATLLEKLSIGDITGQGLPFYSGSVI